MQGTHELSSSVREERQRKYEYLQGMQPSSPLHDRVNGIISSNEQLQCLDKNSVEQLNVERSSCGLMDKQRGNDCCLSLESLSSDSLNLERLTSGFKCDKLKYEQSRRHKPHKDTVSTSHSSHDVSAPRHHIKQSESHGQCQHTLSYSFQCTETDAGAQSQSKFQNILHSKKPPVVSHIQRPRTSFYSFALFLFVSVILASLFPPSMSLDTSLASSSPNLNSWSLAALETIDTGTEPETSHRQVPIPDMTAVVGRLFQFQVPSSAFTGEVSRFKAIRAGSGELPRWIYLDENAGFFSGVPLPEDIGQIYISLDCHMVSMNGKISVQTTIFSLNVIKQNFSSNSSTLENIASSYDQPPNCNLSSTTHLLQCLPSQDRVLANILFFVPFESLSPSERTQLFVNTATLFDTCLQRLELRSVNWTSDEGVWLWSKLATGEIVDSLQSATILSFPIGCENFNYFTQSQQLELIARATDVCRDGLLLSDEGYIWVSCYQWFITAGTKTFLSQTVTLEKTRKKRQSFDETDIPFALPDYENDDTDDPLTTSSITLQSAPSLKTTTTSIQQSPISSSSTHSGSAVSLLPSGSASQPQDGATVLRIQRSFTTSSYITLEPTGEPRTFASSAIPRPSSPVAMTQEVVTLLPSLADPIGSTQIRGQSLAISTTHLVTSLNDETKGQPPTVSSTALDSTVATTTSISLDMPQPSRSMQSSQLPIAVSTSARNTRTSIISSGTPMPTDILGSGAGSPIELLPNFSSSTEALVHMSTVAVESVLTTVPEASSSRMPGANFSASDEAQPPSSSLPIQSGVSLSSSIVQFSSVEIIEPQTLIPFVTISSSRTDRPFIRMSSSPLQSPVIRASSSPFSMGRPSLEISSSSVNELPIDETTAVVIEITPTPSTSRLSFSIASTIEILTSVAILSSFDSSSIEILPTQTFLRSVSSFDVLRPLPSMTSLGIDFTLSSDVSDIVSTAAPTPTLVRTTDVLMPLPTSELSLSMSVFTPRSFPPDTSSSLLPIFTSSFMPSSVIPVSPTATVTSDVRLRPMSTSELTQSISVFSPSVVPPSSATLTGSLTSEIPSPILTLTPTAAVSSITSSFLLRVSDSSENLSAAGFSTSVVQTSSSFLALSTSPIPSTSPSPTPDTPTLCDFINCTNGECVENDTVVCVCFPEWTGVFCEIPIPFLPSPTPSMAPPICFMVDCNNGTCVPNAFETNFTCHCFPGYTGEFCDLPIESATFTLMPTPSPPVPICDLIDCNNGTCVADSFGDDFTCQCFAGYTGDFCDIVITTSSLVTTPTPTISEPISTFSSFLFVFSSSSESLLLPFLTPTPSLTSVSTTFAFSVSSSEFSLTPSTSVSSKFSPLLSSSETLPLPSTTSLPSSIIVSSATPSLPSFSTTPSPSLTLTSLEFSPSSESLPPPSTISPPSSVIFFSATTSLPPFSSSILVSPTPTVNISVCNFVNCTNGLCIELEGDFVTCECFLGYTGMFCEVPMTSMSSPIFTISPSPSPPPFNICDFVDCNNGTCIADELRGDNFTCQCSVGFTGEFCDVLLLSSTSIFIAPTSTMASDFEVVSTSSIIFFVSSSENLLVPFSTLSTTTIPVSSVILTSTPTPTPPISPCDFINCSDNGVCIDIGNDTVICDCFTGLTGIFCDVPIESTTITLMATPTPTPLISPCDFVDCNNGTCVAGEFGENFTCQCGSGYTGEFCDILIPSPTLTITSVATSSEFIFPISSSEFVLLPSSFPSPSSPISSLTGAPSLTSSVPVTVSPSSSSILASPTPTTNISLCSFINCMNGVCIELEGDFVICECFPGYTGMFCEVPIASSSPILTISPTPSPPFNICDIIECNNGTCVADEFGENFTCQCTLEFTGEFCDVPLTMSSSVPLISASSSSSMQFFLPSSESLLVPLSSPSPSVTGISSTPSPITQTPPITTPTLATPIPTPSPNISLCDFVNCTNGECIDLGGDFVLCECFPSWTGIFCDIPITSSSFVLSLSPTPSPSPTRGPCDLVNCHNGSCVPADTFGENFTCQCFSGWTGEFCDVPLPPPSICEFVNCSGNGECIDLGDNDFNCSCFPGFTGEFCAIPLPAPPSTVFVSPTLSPSPSPPVSFCDFINCSGNGNCTDFGDDFNCSCVPEFTGALCDIPILLPSTTQASSSTITVLATSSNIPLVSSSESLLVPLPLPTTSVSLSSSLSAPTPSPSLPLNICNFVNCSGNGECNDLGEDFNCTCYVGWTGPLCEVDIDFCHPNEFGSCNQTGTALCVDGNSTHACECLPGFTGDLCSIDVDDCDPDPCLNNGTCVNLLSGRFECECLPGFTGDLCEEAFSPCDPNPCKEPEQMCTVVGFEAGDFVCVTLPTTTSTTTVPASPSASISVTSSPIILTPSSTVGQPTGITSSPTSSMFVSTSVTPTPTPVPPNSAPVVLNPVGTILANEGQVTHFIIPELTFYDAESGTTSNLQLCLIDFDASKLPNTTWIHITNGAIQALPLREQAVSDLVTDYTFILRASDERGASTHDFVTVRVLRQREDFRNFLVVLFEGSFVTFNQSLSDKIALTQRLSAHINGTSSSEMAEVLSTPDVYVSGFRNGSIAVAYRDISIPDTHCADFLAWVTTVYSYTSSSYTPSFVQILSPRFVPTAQPVIEGPCNDSDTNPTLAATQGLSPAPQSDIILFLSIVIPTIFVAYICLLIGTLLFINYRSRRSERKGIRSRAMERTFTHRGPVILDEEWDLPNRRRRPVILPTDLTIANARALAIVDQAEVDGDQGRRRLLEEVDYGREEESSDEEEIVTSPGFRNRLATMSPDPPLDEGPPPYVLPPLFPT